MAKKLKIILIISAVCLIGAGVFYLSDIWKGNEIQTQTVQNLKLLTSHSDPEAGEEWVVSFETIGNADLAIIPTDRESVGDLDFISLTCDGKEKTEEGALEILDGDVIFYSDWQCDGVGIVTHLVNVARKHTLKFRFGDKAAFAYNNPDSVTDTFADESKIASKSNITVSGGQVYLATCKDNGTACSAAGECCSNYCVDGVCCNNACTGSTCQRCDSYSNAGAGTCGYISTAVDPDSECTTASPPAADSCKSENCSGTGYACGYLAAGEQNQPACKRCSGDSYNPVDFTHNTQDSEGSYVCNNTTGTCRACDSGGTCGYADVDTDPGNQCGTACADKNNYTTGRTCTDICDDYSHQTGNCNGSGGCTTGACACYRIGTDWYPTNGQYYVWDSKNGCYESSANCGTVMSLISDAPTCAGHYPQWTNCDCY